MCEAWKWSKLRYLASFTKEHLAVKLKILEKNTKKLCATCFFFVIFGFDIALVKTSKIFFLIKSPVSYKSSTCKEESNKTIPIPAMKSFSWKITFHLTTFCQTSDCQIVSCGDTITVHTDSLKSAIWYQIFS